ncbi:MAG: hypothetical protein Q7S57_00880 [bacterium]|nr:hypothetical protein [bacterium]
MAKRKSRVMKYQYHINTSINAAKFSIEMFNRIEGLHSKQASIIFNSQAWELLAKAVLIKQKKNIYFPDGRSINAEKAVNQLHHIVHIISLEENQTIQQIISLRNEALHNIYPDLDDEIVTHLIYWSLKTFHRIIKDEFKSYFVKFDKNYLSVAFKDYTFYSHKLSKLFAYSRKSKSEKNRALYILDRACSFAEVADSATYINHGDWISGIKSKPKKSRIGRHLSVSNYTNKQENVRIMAVETPKGYKSEISSEKAKKTSEALSVLVKKSVPEVDYPFLQSDLARQMNVTPYFIRSLAKHLNLLGNIEYHTSIKSGKNSKLQKYSNKMLNFLKEFVAKNPQWSPYKIRAT